MGEDRVVGCINAGCYPETPCEVCCGAVALRMAEAARVARDPDPRGIKFDAAKARWELLPLDAIGAVVADKSPTLGPLVYTYNAAGVAVTGLVDARIRGY